MVYRNEQSCYHRAGNGHDDYNTPVDGRDAGYIECARVGILELREDSRNVKYNSRTGDKSRPGADPGRIYGGVFALDSFQLFAAEIDTTSI